jgi:hypothetical protein
MEFNRDEVDKYAPAQHMIEAKAHRQVVEEFHQSTNGKYDLRHSSSLVLTHYGAAVEPAMAF